MLSWFEFAPCWLGGVCRVTLAATFQNKRTKNKEESHRIWISLIVFFSHLVDRVVDNPSPATWLCDAGSLVGEEGGCKCTVYGAPCWLTPAHWTQVVTAHVCVLPVSFLNNTCWVLKAHGYLDNSSVHKHTHTDAHTHSINLTGKRARSKAEAY